MAWNLSSDRPIFLQIMEKIKVDIVSGKYQPGQKIPSVRELASEAAVNPNTMQKALTELERENLVFSQRTSGRFITEDEQMIQVLRMEMAREKVTDFLASMRELGFEKEDIVCMMADEEQEEHHE